jgi:hypothetical protein
LGIKVLRTGLSVGHFLFGFYFFNAGLTPIFAALKTADQT